MNVGELNARIQRELGFLPTNVRLADNPLNEEGWWQGGGVTRAIVPMAGGFAVLENDGRDRFFPVEDEHGIRIFATEDDACEYIWLDTVEVTAKRAGQGEPLTDDQAEAMRSEMMASYLKGAAERRDGGDGSDTSV